MTNIESALTTAIDRHAAGFPDGKLESHDFSSLEKRTLAPAAYLHELLAAGELRSERPTHSNDPTGRQTFLSTELNRIRRGVLCLLAAAVIENSDTAAQAISATSHALRLHSLSFDKPRGKTELSRFPKGLVRFSRDREDEPGVVHRAVSTAGKLAAVGGLGYGAASLLRGRKLRPSGSLADKLRAGHAANVGTLSGGARRVAAVVGGLRRPR